MREDMFKVIVERPRHGRYWHRERPEPRDLEYAPDHEGLRARHLLRKSLNENLRPLERFLASQVGRPWDKVYSEICANIDRRSTVQQHIHQHLADFVAIRVVDVEGVLHEVGRWSWPRPLEERWAAKFWVDPRTGLLRRNSGRTRARVQARQACDEAEQRRGQYRRVLDAWRQLHCVQGLWFEVDLAPIPAAPPRGVLPYDVLRRAPVAAGSEAGKRKAMSATTMPSTDDAASTPAESASCRRVNCATMGSRIASPATENNAGKPKGPAPRKTMK